MDYEHFAPLVTPHTATMTRLAAALVGIADAEDAAQEALMRAWRAWPGLREADSTRAWLLQITVNICRTWRARSLGRRQSSEDSLDAAALVEDIASTMLGATNHVMALDLRQALLTLSADLRQVIALRFYIGMDSTEIGELLHESPATVRARLRRALIQLRRTLDEGHRPTSATRATDGSPDCGMTALGAGLVMATKQGRGHAEGGAGGRLGHRKEQAAYFGYGQGNQGARVHTVAHIRWVAGGRYSRGCRTAGMERYRRALARSLRA